MLICWPFLYWFLSKAIEREQVVTSPVRRNNPPKLPKAIAPESATFSSFWQLFWSIHFFSIWMILSPSVMLRIALDISVSRGDRLGSA
jgi:hypothetical protein